MSDRDLAWWRGCFSHIQRFRGWHEPKLCALVFRIAHESFGPGLTCVKICVDAAAWNANCAASAAKYDNIDQVAKHIRYVMYNYNMNHDPYVPKPWTSTDSPQDTIRRALWGSPASPELGVQVVVGKSCELAHVIRSVSLKMSVKLRYWDTKFETYPDIKHPYLLNIKQSFKYMTSIHTEAWNTRITLFLCQTTAPVEKHEGHQVHQCLLHVILQDDAPNDLSSGRLS